MHITPLGNIIVRHNLGREMGYSCNFGPRHVQIDIARNGVVTFCNSTARAFATQRMQRLRDHLATILRAERQLKQMGL